MTTIKFRRDTSANWTSVNPIPAQGEPCYETDTGKLKIGNGSDNYTALPYVSDDGGDLPIASTTRLGVIKVGDNLNIAADGTLSAGVSGTTDYTQLENKPQINSVELTGNKTLDDLGIQAKGDYATSSDIQTLQSDINTRLKTSQVASTEETSSGIYLNSSSNSLTTVQPVFDIFDGALETNSINYLKAATYSATEPSDDDMTNNWTNEDGFFTGFTSHVGYISGNVKFGAGSGSSQVIFKLMESAYITGVKQAGRYKFSKIEISTDGTTYTEYSGVVTNAKYLRFTFDYYFSGVTYASFSTRIETSGSNIAGGTARPLSIKVDNNTISIINDKLVGNITSDMVDTTYMKINSDGKLSVDTAAVAHLAMPSQTAVNLTLGASGTSYTAPADGYLFATVQTANSGGVIELAQTNGVNYYCRTFETAQLSGNVPVSSGANVTFNYLSSNSATDKIGFTYCNGTVPAA